LWLIGVLWTLALLVPFAPGLPKVSGLPWRQEFALALLLALAFALLVRQVWRKENAARFHLRRDELQLALPLLLFTLWSAASLMWAADFVSALHHTLVWSTYLLFFLLMRRAVESARLLRSTLITLGFVICVLGIACAVEFWGAPSEIDGHIDQLFRYFNGFGEMLAACIPIYAALALRLRRTRAAIFCGLTAVIAWLAIFQVSERAPIIGAAFGLLILAGASIFTRRFRPGSLTRALVLVAAFAAVTALQFIPSTLTAGRISAAARLQSTSISEPNTRVRLLFWGIGLEMWREHPFGGVGAGNYNTAYPEARAQFSARHADSDLIAMDEEMLVERAHNEYVQILGELGAFGFTLFIVFAVGLLIAACRVLRRARSPLALGAVCSLAAFALSSGASSASFRWMGSGLIFFFAAALVSRFSAKREEARTKIFNFSPAFARTALVSALVFSLLMLAGRGAQTANAFLRARLASAPTAARAEELFNEALVWNQRDAPTHFSYGMFLYHERRAAEAVTHLRYAVAHGYNASVCYAYLTAAEAGANDLPAAEQTLAEAVRVYPRSAFLHVRHATALAEVGRTEDANAEYASALALNARVARGWRELICFGRKEADRAAFADKSIALPGELVPENCIFAILDENDRRQPVAVLEESSSLSATIR
jgi:O-antigen ligase